MHKILRLKHKFLVYQFDINSVNIAKMLIIHNWLFKLSSLKVKGWQKMHNKHKNIYPCLKAFCALKGENAGSLARLLCTSKGTMASRLHGKSEFTLKEANILSSHFGVPIEALFSADAQIATETVKDFTSTKR